jgi:hypothetical protein
MAYPSAIYDFSDHLFWDTDRSNIDMEAHKAQIIYKVLEFGTMDDWRLLQTLYSKETMAEVVTNLPSLDPVTLSFIANHLRLDKTAFRCYKKKPLTRDFWNS